MKLHQINQDRGGSEAMKTKLTARILLIILILAMAALACGGGGGGGGGGSGDGDETQSAETISADATATFGAEQFHAQLTAVAQPQSQP